MGNSTLGWRIRRGRRRLSMERAHHGLISFSSKPVHIPTTRLVAAAEVISVEPSQKLNKIFGKRIIVIQFMSVSGARKACQGTGNQNRTFYVLTVVTMVPYKCRANVTDTTTDSYKCWDLVFRYSCFVLTLQFLLYKGAYCPVRGLG